MKEIIKMLESVGVKFEKGLTERDFQNEFVKPKIEPIPFWNSLL